MEAFQSKRDGRVSQPKGIKKLATTEKPDSAERLLNSHAPPPYGDSEEKCDEGEATERKERSQNTKAGKPLITKLVWRKRAEIKSKLRQLEKCSRGHREELSALHDIAFGKFKKSWELGSVLGSWNSLSTHLKWAKLKWRCETKTLDRFEEVYAQCIEAFREFDAWLWASYDLIEREGVEIPTAASAERVRLKIGPTEEALHRKLAPLHGRMELIAKDLFDNWRRW